MNPNIKLVFYLIGVTLLFLFLALVSQIVSVILFQGHIHPDDWRHNWKDTLLLVTVAIAYILSVAKLVKRHSHRKNS